MAKSPSKGKRKVPQEPSESPEDDDKVSESPTKKAKKKEKKPKPEPVTEVDACPRKPVDELKQTLKVISWNVDGLRAPGRGDALRHLVATENPEVIVLQETKLQEAHVEEWRDLLPGYTSYWTCSTLKKGYAGSGAYVKQTSEGLAKKAKSGISSFFAKKSEDEAKAKPSKAALRSVSFGIGPANENFGIKETVVDWQGDTDKAGRSITLEFDEVVVVALYVPNSGQKLENIDHRVDRWDPALQEYVSGIEEKTSKPVVVCGDLNVAHADIDIYNYFAPHMEKTPGCTQRERNSFTEWLEKGYADALRHMHPEARGQYTYWSTRANNRPSNKGLRLDYFVCPQKLLEPAQEGIRVHDTFTMPDSTTCSDHCPVGLILACN